LDLKTGNNRRLEKFACCQHLNLYCFAIDSEGDDMKEDEVGQGRICSVYGRSKKIYTDY
jgi:hypothetical protein